MLNVKMEWFRATRCDRLWITAAAAPLLALALGCGGDLATPSQPSPPTKLDPGPFVVSNAVAAQTVSAAVMPNGMRLGASAVSSMAYVSLPPGAIPDATSAMISTSTDGGSSVTTLIVDGGFDPIPIAAEAGDTLLIQVQGTTAAAKMSYRMRVAPRTRPVVVRTTPPPHKRDVALNYLIQVVFSEPMDSATLGGAVRLTAGGAPVPGVVKTVTTNGVVLQATFVPAELLQAQSDYQLRVDTTARDAGGDPLAAPVATDFTTGGAVADTTGGDPPLDTLPPTVSILSPAPGDTVATDYLTVALHVGAPNGLSEIEMTVDDGSANGSVIFGDATSFSGDAILHSFPRLSAGARTLSVSVTDATGRVGTSGPLTIVAVVPDTEQRIVVRSFEVLEIERSPTQWEYSPQLVVADSAGGTGLSIVGFEMLTLPGIASPFPRLWARDLSVPQMQDVPLIREWYGDWDVGFVAQDGHRSRGGTATARLTYRDATGHLYAATLEGPIVPGSPPSTYTGGCTRWVSGYYVPNAYCPSSLELMTR